MRICDVCGTRCRDDMKECPRCGAELKILPAANSSNARFCDDCGTRCSSEMSHCPRCGAELKSKPTGPVYREPRDVPRDVPSYLALSIIVTVLCCIPFGIVAIVHAARSGTFLQAGDYSAAADESEKAKMWCIISVVLGLLAGIIAIFTRL